MKVCYLFCDTKFYIRNRIILDGLKRNNIEVIECKSNLNNQVLRDISQFFQFLFKKRNSDIILVGFVGFSLVRLVKPFTKKPIIFDAFMSVYNTMVEDKKKFKKNSVFAKFFWWLDKSACSAADLTLVDTDAHCDYFSE